MTAGGAELIALAAGGTGGHVFPAQALAAELQRRGHLVAVITDARGASFGEDVATYTIPAARLERSVRGIAAAVREMMTGTTAALRLLRRLRPVAVVGFGGYASVPPVLAARLLGIPRVLHEQNAVLGRANRFLANQVDRIAVSFAEVAAVRQRNRRKLVRTGNPVRPAIARARTPYSPPGPDGRVNLLVLGGSQGARVFSDVIPEALALLPPALRQRICVVQQCRSEDVDRVREAYAASAVSAELSSFFSDIPERLAASHLVLTRAGASSVAELAAAGRPGIFVPYPFATDDHQTANARALDAAGAGWLIPQRAFSPETVSARIESLIATPKLLDQAAANAAGLFQADAAARLSDLVEDVARGDAQAVAGSRIRGAVA